MEDVVVADVARVPSAAGIFDSNASVIRACVASLTRELGEDRAAARDEGVDDHAAVVSVVCGATAQLSVSDALPRFVAGVILLPVARRLSCAGGQTFEES